MTLPRRHPVAPPALPPSASCLPSSPALAPACLAFLMAPQISARVLPPPFFARLALRRLLSSESSTAFLALSSSCLSATILAIASASASASSLGSSGSLSTSLRARSGVGLGCAQR